MLQRFKELAKANKETVKKMALSHSKTMSYIPYVEGNSVAVGVSYLLHLLRSVNWKPEDRIVPAVICGEYVSQKLSVVYDLIANGTIACGIGFKERVGMPVELFGFMYIDNSNLYFLPVGFRGSSDIVPVPLEKILTCKAHPELVEIYKKATSAIIADTLLINITDALFIFTTNPTGTFPLRCYPELNDTIVEPSIEAFNEYIKNTYLEYVSTFLINTLMLRSALKEVYSKGIDGYFRPVLLQPCGTHPGKIWLFVSNIEQVGNDFYMVLEAPRISGSWFNPKPGKAIVPIAEEDLKLFNGFYATHVLSQLCLFVNGFVEHEILLGQADFSFNRANKICAKHVKEQLEFEGVRPH